MTGRHYTISSSRMEKLEARHRSKPAPKIDVLDIAIAVSRARELLNGPSGDELDFSPTDADRRAAHAATLAREQSQREATDGLRQGDLL